jgi:hypothetical protein
MTLSFYAERIGDKMLGSDLALAPNDYKSICALPNLPVFDVTKYGAKGDDATDDTKAIRSALGAAVASGGGIVYLPTGIYRVCPQPYDTFPDVWRPIFRVNTSRIVFAGDGPGKSVLSGYFDGMNDPKLHWLVTTDSYVKITRFMMFGVAYDYQAHAPIDTVQIRSLTIRGNANWTGNTAVGGNPTTGDGWDMGHKAIAFSSPTGGNSITNVLIYNCDVRGWRGEGIYSGSTPIKPFTVLGCTLDNINADAISVDEGCDVWGCSIGLLANVSNGIENYTRTKGTANRIRQSKIKAVHNGMAHLGLPGTYLVATANEFIGCDSAILMAEAANNVYVSGNAFVNCRHSIIGAIFELYKNDPHGFAKWYLRNNSVVGGGSLLVNQGDTIPDLQIIDNTIGAGATMLTGSFDAMPGFVVSGNHIASGASDVHSYTGGVGLWSGNVRDTGSIAGCKFDYYGTDSVAIIDPQMSSDILWLNAKPGAVQLIAIDPKQLPLYPVGFVCRAFSTSGPGWAWAPGDWNTFSAPVQIPGVPGVAIRKNAAGLFELAP